MCMERLLTSQVLHRNHSVFGPIMVGAYGHRAWPITEGFAEGFAKGLLISYVPQPDHGDFEWFAVEAYGHLAFRQISKWFE